MRRSAIGAIRAAIGGSMNCAPAYGILGTMRKPDNNQSHPSPLRA